MVSSAPRIPTVRGVHKPARYADGIQHMISFVDPHTHPSSERLKSARMPCSSMRQNSVPRALRMKLSGHAARRAMFARQTCTLLSASLQATSAPSCDTATEKILFERRRGSVHGSPLSESNILMLASSEADTILRPSGERAIALMGPV